MTELLGEYIYLPCNSQKPPEKDICNIILQPLFNWPNDLIDMIKMVLSMPCPSLKHPELKFDLSTEAALHKLNNLSKYNYELNKAPKAQQDSPLGYSKEFKPPDVLTKIFGLHPLWQHMDSILPNGSKWLLVEISKDKQKTDLNNALTFGNHKGASAKI